MKSLLQNILLFCGMFTLLASEERGPTKPRVGEIDYEKARQEWAFRKPVMPQIPKVRDTNWPKSPIDRFVLEKLEAKKLRPAAAAEKATLLRRATFDLIGLPPTPKEIDAFISDTATNAFEKVVDRLLTSPHYGERWARHWLDVVRYTDSFDSRGIGGEADVPEAWRYRDWVVNALNRDLPYDEFVTEQIAGDILATNSPGFDAQKLIATGVYVIGEWGTGDADKEKMLTDIVDDQIDVTGRAFLGLTLACARCHDHKFDPISTQDYYSMAGIFFSSHILPSPGAKTAGSPVLRIPLAAPEEIAARTKRDGRIAELEKQIERTRNDRFSALAKSTLPQTARYLEAAAAFRSGTKLQTPGLIPQLVDSWLEFLGEPRLPLLTKQVTNVRGNAGIHALQNPAGADTPSLTVNVTEKEISFITITLPPRSAAVHPSPKAGVTIQWQSPITGAVRVRGRVADADDKCGNGIEWALISGKLKLTGTIENGASMKIGLEQPIMVKSSDLISLTISPRGDYSCDTTVVELAVSDENRTWDFTSDVLAAFESGTKSLNPFGVWSVYDAAAPKKREIAAGSLLAKWIASPTRETAEALQAYLMAPNRDTNAPDAWLYTELTNPAGSFWSAARNDELLGAEARAELGELQAELKALKAQPMSPITVAHGLQEGGTPKSAHEGIHDVRVHIRGRYDRLGESAPRAFPRVLAEQQRSATFTGSGRLELAKWIASRENPLTARVMVNRIWQHHFGEGIVRTPNNYGKLGTPPTHPELLDYLALQFINSGWSIKAVHKAIMLSATYQQSSIPDPATLKADPDNLFFGRMNRRRLESEEIRDSLLAVANRLDRTAGGPASRKLETPRRTLYIMTIRSERATYQSLFDAADPNAIVEQRNVSTVAPQALFLLNNPFVLEQAKAVAERVEAEAPNELSARARWLYRLLYGRLATEDEIRVARSIVGNGESDWMDYCHLLLCANEFVYVD